MLGVFSKRLFSSSSIKEVIVVGGGLMGSGIAQVAVQSGHKATLVDLDQTILDKTEKRIRESVARVAKRRFRGDGEQEEATKFVEESLSNLRMTTKVETAIETADLLVEAVLENMALKQKLFRDWDAMAPPKTILASNTSTLSIGEMTKDVKRLDKVGGLHFFNPH